MIYYRETKPVKALQTYILNYWTFSYHPDDPSAILQHSIIPDGCVSLMIVFSDKIPPVVMLTGPRPNILETQVNPGWSYLGIRFRPSAAKGLLGISPDTIRECTVEVEPGQLNDLDVAALAGIVAQNQRGYEEIDDCLLQWIRKLEVPIDEMISRTIDLIIASDGTTKISELARQAHLSERQFQRRFRQAVGLTPKEFSRIRRLRRAVIELVLNEKDRQDIVFEQGYFDPAHFVRDISTMGGTSPGALAKYISQIKHVNVD